MAKAKAAPAAPAAPPAKEETPKAKTKAAPKAKTKTFRARYNNDNDHNIKIFVEQKNITEWRIIESLLPEHQTDPEEIEFFHKTIEYKE